MPLSTERRAQMDAVLQGQGGVSQMPMQGSLTPERRAQMDAILNGAQKPTQSQQAGGFQQFVQGVAKPFLRTATNVLNFGEGIADLVKGDVQGAHDAATKERDFGYFGQDIRPIGVNDSGQFRNLGGFAKDVIGTGAEIGSYLAPVGVGAAAKSARVLPKVASGVGAGTIAGGLAGGGQALQSDQGLGETAVATLKGAAGGALVGGLLPTAGAATGAAGRLVGRVGAEVLGKSTGAGEAAIREAFKNPNVIKFARQAGKEGPEGLMNQALEEARQGLNILKRSRGQAYVSQLEKIKLDKVERDTIITEARNAARQLVQENGIMFKEGRKLNNLNFDGSTIERGQGSVQKAFNDVMGWTDTTAAGLDKLQKKLSQHLDEIPVTERGGAYNIILKLKDSVSEPLKKSVPGYEAMTAKYREASALIDEIQRALSLKDTQASDTAIRKLMSTMKQSNELRKELIEVLGKSSGKDITGKIAGATLSPATPRGLAGTFQPTITGLGGVSLIVNPSTLPFILLYLVTSSPRLVAEAVSILGRVKGPKIPLLVQQQIRNLIIQASQSNPSGENSGANGL